MNRFIDAPQSERCTAVITLKDGSTAQCGRRRKVGDLCTQHARLQAIARNLKALLNYSAPIGDVEAFTQMDIEVLRAVAAEQWFRRFSVNGKPIGNTGDLLNSIAARIETSLLVPSLTVEG